MIKRSLIFVHRWLGVVLCLLFLIWFPSGFVMMYWGFPGVTAADRLTRAPALDPSSVHVEPADAAATAGVDMPRQVRLNMFDGRPVYRFRSDRGEAIVYADTGQTRAGVSKEMVDRIAAAWSGQALRTARVTAVDDVDQWTIQLRGVKPLWKYAWPDGQEVYVSQASGDIVQYTTTRSRWAAYFGAIPHWLYFTPLRKHGPQWSQVVIWTSGIGTVAAILGLVIGVWVSWPAKRIPYRGQKRWHAILGLIFGVGAVTWAFSGMLSMDPFPTPPPGRVLEAGAIPLALRGGDLELTRFTERGPAEALRQLPGLNAKELELATFAGEPVYLATFAAGNTRIVPIHGQPLFEFDRKRIAEIVTNAAKVSGGADVRLLTQYDMYYLDRRRERPLPVLLAEIHDVDRTRYYIDPASARIVGTYDSRNWVSRWLYHGLHSLDFPWLYNYRPLWDIVVITFMIGGTALCVTSLVLAWRVLGRTLRGSVVQVKTGN